MKSKYYHATSEENGLSIISECILANNLEHSVYLCKTVEDAVKFVAIRGIKHVLVFEVNLEDDEVVESFDHSYGFFKCPAYIYPGDIPVSAINQNNITLFTLQRKEG